MKAADYRPDAARSKVMASIRQKDTGPEMRVRRFLHGRGLRYKLHAPGMLGKPDLVFRSRRIVVFVHGCFWHRHRGCKATRTPKTRRDFWVPKFRSNIRRDAAVAKVLAREGWRVIVVWECQTRDERALNHLAKTIEEAPQTKRS